MMLINALKTVCDFLLYFSFATLFASYSETWLLMGVVLVLAFVSSLILQKTKGTLTAKILCGLLPALGLFAARNLTEVLITAVILAIYLVLTLAEKNDIHYDDYKYWFGLPAVLVIVLFVICFSKWPVRRASVVCAVLYLFFGVLVLRRKRIGAGADLKLRLMNLMEVGGMLVFSVLACFLLYTIFMHSGKVIEILVLPIGFVFQGLVYVLSLFGNLLTENQPEETVASTEAVTTASQDFSEDEPPVPVPGGEANYAWFGTVCRVLLIILAIAVLAYLLYRLYRMFRAIRPEEAGADGPVEAGEAEGFRFRRKRQKRRKKLAGPTNNEKIRRIYKDYLFYVRIRGVEIGRQTTSAEVLESAGALTAPGKAERLRELYIRARYHDAEEMSDAEVEEAEKLLAEIKEPPAA